MIAEDAQLGFHAGMVAMQTGGSRSKQAMLRILACAVMVALAFSCGGGSTSDSTAVSPGSESDAGIAARRDGGTNASVSDDASTNGSMKPTTPSSTYCESQASHATCPDAPPSGACRADETFIGNLLASEALKVYVVCHGAP